MVNSPLIQDLAHLRRILGFVEDMRTRAPGSMLIGQVIQVKTGDDAKGEVEVVYESLDPRTNGSVGTEARKSVWIPPAFPFEGEAPQSLIGEKVLIGLKDSDWNLPYYIAPTTLQEPVGSLIRLATYDRESLPPATAKNLGAVAIEKDWPPGSHSTVMVVKRDGKYVWAGSSHSIMEVTPLTTAAKEAVNRAASQELIFNSAGEAILSGDAFDPIKDPKKRAITQGISTTLYKAVESAVLNVLSPLQQVDIQILEAAFTRHLERLNDVATMADKIEAFAEMAISDPLSIPKGLKAIKDLIGGTLDSVKVIADDVRRFVGQDLTQVAKSIESNFKTEIQEFFPKVTKELAPIVGGELTRIVGGSPVEALQQVLSFPSQFTEPLSEAIEAIDDIGGFFGVANIIPPELSQGINLIRSFPQEVLALIPGDIIPFLSQPRVIEEFVSVTADRFRSEVDLVSNNSLVWRSQDLVTGAFTSEFKAALDRGKLLLEIPENANLGQIRFAVESLKLEGFEDIVLQGNNSTVTVVKNLLGDNVQQNDG